MNTVATRSQPRTSWITIGLMTLIVTGFGVVADSRLTTAEHSCTDTAQLTETRNLMGFCEELRRVNAVNTSNGNPCGVVQASVTADATAARQKIATHI